MNCGTLTFIIPGPIDTQVTVSEQPDGTLLFEVEAVNGGGLHLDYRGLFFDVDASSDFIDGLDVAIGGDVTDFKAKDDKVNDLGNGANVKGAVSNASGKFDVGVEIGTQGKAADDIESYSFVLSHETEDLSLALIAQMDFAVRATSVGPEGNREDSFKAGGQSTAAPIAVKDAAETISESPTGFDIDIDVLANDSDADGDTLFVTSVGAADMGGVFSINPDGTINFDPGADFDDLDSGEFVTTTATYYISDGNGGTNCAEVCVTVEGFDPGEQEETDTSGLVSLTSTTSERTIDGTAPYAATIALPDIDSDIAFIIDVSGSTQNSFDGTAVGDVNGDGSSNTILDAEIASFLSLLDAITADPAGTVNVRLISFAGGAASTGTFDVTDAAGKAALEAALTSLDYGGTTNYEAALDEALNFFDGIDNEVGYFLSDGFPNGGGDFTDEAAALDGLGVSMVAVGVGDGSRLSDLNVIDNTGGAQQVLSTNELTATLLESPFDVIDFVVEVNGVEVVGIDETDLVESPLGFTLPEQLLAGLDVGEDDDNTVEAFAYISTDGNDLDHELVLTTNQLVNGVVYNELLV